MFKCKIAFALGVTLTEGFKLWLGKVTTSVLEIENDERTHNYDGFELVLFLKIHGNIA